MPETQREPVPRDDDGELSVALSFLDFARSCVLKKLDGLSDADARRPMVPSGTSVLRLVRHLTDGEVFWFQVHFLGIGTEPAWDSAGADLRPAEQIVADYRAACARSNEIVRETGDLDVLSARPLDGRPQSLRWTLAHMTSETARHAGHGRRRPRADRRRHRPLTGSTGAARFRRERRATASSAAPPPRASSSDATPRLTGLTCHVFPLTTRFAR